MIDKKLSWFDVLNYGIMLVVCFTMIYPFLHILSLSLSDPIGAGKGGFMFYPRGIQFDTYKGLIKDSLFWRSYLNIIIVTTIGVTVALLLISMASYVLTVPYYPFRKTIMMMITMTMFFQAGIIPNYLLIKKLGLMNTWFPLWIPGITAAFYLIILISFFRQIPAEIKEAAVIDGAGEINIFFRILIPLSKPVLATVALFLAVTYWNDWFSPYIYLNNPSKYTLPVVLRQYVVSLDMSSFSGFVKSSNKNVMPEQLRATVILVSILPTLILYPFIQRYFVKGVTLGSLKG
jgi:putative aldouronate transport system permease protein